MKINDIWPNYDSAPSLMSPKEVAKLTGYSLQTLAHHRITKKPIEFIKVGRMVRYLKSAVAAWLLKNAAPVSGSAR